MYLIVKNAVIAPTNEPKLNAAWYKGVMTLEVFSSIIDICDCAEGLKKPTKKPNGKNKDKGLIQIKDPNGGRPKKEVSNEDKQKEAILQTLREMGFSEEDIKELKNKY